MKKSPFHKYEKENDKHPYIGLMASDSNNREINYIKNGCNVYDNKYPSSKPLSFWLTEDIWLYINKFKLDYSDIYNKGYYRTGCMFCMFGVHLEKEPNSRKEALEMKRNRIQHMVDMLQDELQTADKRLAVLNKEKQKLNHQDCIPVEEQKTKEEA